jgi:hypothetical protein
VTVGTLADIAGKARAVGVRPPAVIVIGGVVELYEGSEGSGTGLSLPCVGTVPLFFGAYSVSLRRTEPLKRGKSLRHWTVVAISLLARMLLHSKPGDFSSSGRAVRRTFDQLPV